MLRICFFVVALAAVSLAAQPCGSSSCSSRRRCHCQSEIAQLQEKIEGLEAKVNQLTAASTTSKHKSHITTAFLTQDYSRQTGTFS